MSVGDNSDQGRLPETADSFQLQPSATEASSKSMSTGTPALTLNELRDQVYEWAQSKGWWDDADNRNIPSKLALVHSEISEALEEYREGRMETWYSRKSGPDTPPMETQSGAGVDGIQFRLSPMDRWRTIESEADWARLGYESKPEGFASEIADVFIRLADLCGYLNIDIEKEVALKMEYNHTRSYRHGGKKV